MFDDYQIGDRYDEMYAGSDECRAHYLPLKSMLESVPMEQLAQLQESADKAQMSMGMTFNVYHDNQGVEKILHLDIVPRIITGQEWEKIERGLQQRIEAINLFIHDIYHEQKIFKDKVIPKDLILSCPDYLEACQGLRPPKDIWCHIAGSDIIRDKDGAYFILEDNLRCPSGVSYMLENREIIKGAFPSIFQTLGVRRVSDYPSKLLSMLKYLSDRPDPEIAVLTPGIYNSAYFEHSYLAQQMGVELVSGRDLIVQDNKVFMQTTKGLQPVDVLYRRIDDQFMDPLTFRKDSMLGVPGLFQAYKKGNVAIANAPGTGVADDKAVYAYIERVINYYMDQDPIINNVPTYLCEDPSEMNYVLENISQLVVKETNAAGGYGMLIGPKSGKEEHDKFRELIKSNPRNYIAQPTLNLSTVPTLCDGAIEGRHVDLRPYILYGSSIDVVPGALTRVALVKGSLVVNSSQGGGCKDTWVLE